MRGYAIARGYIQFFEPDVFVEAEKGLAELTGLGALREKHRDPEILTLDEFFDRGERSRGEPQFGLGISDVLQHLYISERRFKLRDDYGAVLPKRARDSCLVEAVFGAYPNGRNVARFQREFAHVFRPDDSVATHETWLKVFKSGALTPLRVTRHAIDLERHWNHDPIIFVFDPSKPIDVIDLWNERIQPRPVLPVPVQWFAPLSDLLRKFIKDEHRPIIGNPSGMMHHATVKFGSSIGEEEAKRLSRKHLSGLPQGAYRSSVSRSRIWEPTGPYMSPRERISANVEERQISVPIERERGASIEVETLSPSFASRFGGHHWRWVNVLTISTFSSDDIAQILPRNTFDRRWPRLSAIGHRTPVSSEGWVFAQQYPNWTERVTLLENDQAIVQWLETQKIRARLSEPGRIGKQILRSLERLWAVHVLRDPDTLKLLNKMASSTRRRNNETGDVEETFEGRTVSVKDWRDHVEKRKAQQFPRLEFADFSDRNVIRLGIETTCPHCDYTNWHGLDVVDYEIKCDRCLDSYPFPQSALRDQNKNWRYRVIGPFSTPDYARGSYASLLTIKALANLRSSTETATYCPALELTFPDDAKAEVDFAMWLGGERQLGVWAEPQLIIGEAKSFGAEILKEKDTTQMRRVAKWLPDATLVFSVLKDQFTDNEKRLLSKIVRWAGRASAAREPRNVVLLTGVELFADFHIESTWKKLGPPYSNFADYHHFNSLANFAEATQQIHLGKTAREGSSRRGRTRKRAARGP